MMATLTPDQCRMGRAALEWSQQDLASKSGVGSTSVKKFELGAPLRPLLLSALRRAMEDAGVGFIDEGATVMGQSASFGAFLRSGFGSSTRSAARNRRGAAPDAG